MDERRLIGKLISRDPAAWEHFLQHYGPILYRASRAVLTRSHQPASEAEDISQQVLTLLVERDGRLLRSFQGRSTLSTWLIGITRRQTLMHLRRQKRLDVPPPASSLHSPLDDIEIAETEEHLNAATANLTPRERLLLRLYYYERLSYQEIAEILDVSSNSISPLLGRARERLKEQLAHLKKS